MKTVMGSVGIKQSLAAGGWSIQLLDGADAWQEVALIKVDQPHSLPLGTHRHAWEERWWIMQGSLELQLMGKQRLLHTGDFVCIAANQWHSLKTLTTAFSAVYAGPVGLVGALWCQLQNPHSQSLGVWTLGQGIELGV